MSEIQNTTSTAEDFTLISKDELLLRKYKIVGRPDLIYQHNNGYYFIIDYKNRKYVNHNIFNKDRYQMIVYMRLCMKHFDTENVVLAIDYIDYSAAIVPTNNDIINVDKAIKELSYKYNDACKFYRKITGFNLQTATGIANYLDNPSIEKAIKSIFESSIDAIGEKRIIKRLEAANTISEESSDWDFLMEIKSKNNYKSDAQKAGIERHKTIPA